MELRVRERFKRARRRLVTQRLVGVVIAIAAVRTFLDVQHSISETIGTFVGSVIGLLIIGIVLKTIFILFSG